MPPIIPSRRDQMMQALAFGANGVRAMATQQQQNISTPSGQVVYSTGILYQQGTSTNYTTGYGWEIPSNGLGSAPAMRAGFLTWVSPAGTQLIAGIATFGGDGSVSATLDENGLRFWNANGEVLSSFTTDQILINDTGGNPVTTLPWVLAGEGLLSSGSLSVSETQITANSIVRTYNISGSGTVGALSVSLSAGTGFTVHSTSGADTSKIRWEVVSW